MNRPCRDGSVPCLSGKFAREVGVGYENIKHFNAIFKKKFNLTPRKFRTIQG